MSAEVFKVFVNIRINELKYKSNEKENIREAYDASSHSATLGSPIGW